MIVVKRINGKLQADPDFHNLLPALESKLPAGQLPAFSRFVANLAQQSQAVALGLTDTGLRRSVLRAMRGR